MARLESLTVRGYRSFPLIDLTFNLGANVLVGANGAGKSNIVGLFRILDSFIKGDFQKYVSESGGASALLHYGPKVTKFISVESRTDHIQEGNLKHTFKLNHNQEDSFQIENEWLSYAIQPSGGVFHPSTSSREESILSDPIARGHPSSFNVSAWVRSVIASWGTYHFHDTSRESGWKQNQPTSDSVALASDGRNVAPFLLYLHDTSPVAFEAIQASVRLAFPQFGAFVLEPNPVAETVRLRWREDHADIVFGPHQLSDGTLRFIGLATLLLQPKLPSTVILDEPELGLHPAALQLLVELVRGAIVRGSQVIMTTQSPYLLNFFEPNEIIVIDRNTNPETGRAESVARRLDAESLKAWLEEYTLGDLWLKNVLGGRP